LTKKKKLDKIYTHKNLGEITITKKKRNKNIRLSIRKEKIRVSIPFFVSYTKAIQFITKNESWINHTLATQKSNRESLEAQHKVLPCLNTTTEIEEARKTARLILEPRLASIAIKYGFKYNKVGIKNNKSNWGSCSSKRNINLNIRLIYLPEILADAVILHELAHLHHLNHGPRFHQELDTLIKDYTNNLYTEKRAFKELLEWHLY